MSSGDGGDVSVDLANLELYDPGSGPVEVSNRYRCSQNLGGFRRERRDASNNDLGTVNPAMTVVSGNPDPKWRWLNAHDWPGNVRELENLCQRAVALAEGDTFDTDVLSLTGSLAPTRRAPLQRLRGPAKRRHSGAAARERRR